MNPLLEQGESRETSNIPPENRMTLQLALRALCGIRQRYEVERAAHPDTRLYSVHVALDDLDMVWIAATIAALQKPIAAGAIDSAGRAAQSSSGNVN